MKGTVIIFDDANHLGKISELMIFLIRNGSDSSMQHHTRGS